MSFQRERSMKESSVKERMSESTRTSKLENNTGSDTTLRRLERKMKERSVKLATIVSRCEDYDVNSDGMIHIDDLSEIFADLFGRDVITKREINIIAPLISKSKSKIEYAKLLNLIDDPMNNISENLTEKWLDDEEDVRKNKWATERGSVGEWLHRGACPSEIKNFKRFIACLESFERSSGMKCVQKEDGFVVPLGPDLKVSVNFFMG
eukprot:gene7290-9932_t